MELIESPAVGYGLTLIGRSSHLDPEMGVYVSGLSRGGEAERTRQVRIGDRVMHINGQAMLASTVAEALGALQVAGGRARIGLTAAYTTGYRRRLALLQEEKLVDENDVNIIELGGLDSQGRFGPADEENGSATAADAKLQEMTTEGDGWHSIGEATPQRRPSSFTSPMPPSPHAQPSIFVSNSFSSRLDSTTLPTISAVKAPWSSTSAASYVHSSEMLAPASDVSLTSETILQFKIDLSSQSRWWERYYNMKDKTEEN